MNPIVYALFSYTLTAVISFLVIAVIVVIDRIMSKTGKETKEKGN